MSKLKALAGQTVLYGLGSILPRMLNFLLVPLHTINMFSKAEYGAVTKLFAFVGFLNVVYMFGMETSFFRFASKAGADEKKVFNITQTCVLLISVSLTIIFIVFSSSCAAYAGIPNHPEFITWLALTMLIDAVVAIPFARLRLQKKALLFASAKIINVVILIGLNYYFLKVAYDSSVGIGYVFLATLIANGLYVVFFLRDLIQWRPVWDKELSPQIIRYGYPIMLTGVAGMTNEMFSRLTLDWWLPSNFYPGLTTDEAGGVFGACYKFAVLMNLGIQAFRYAAEPFFFSHASDKKSPALFASINHYFIIVCCFVLVGVSINLDILSPLFIGEEFRQGLSIVPVLLLAYLFLGVYYNMSVWFKLIDKTHYGTWITVVGAVITITGNFILIPIYGYLGSSIAAFLCYFSMTVICYWYGQKYYHIPYPVMSGFLYIAFSFALVYGVGAITVSNQWIAASFHIAVLLLFASIVFFIERKNWKRDQS